MRKIHVGFFFKLSGQQIPWGRDRDKDLWNSWGYNFFLKRYVSETDKSDNTRFQKNFGLSVSMVTNHLWSIKTSTLPKVSPSKVRNIKM